MGKGFILPFAAQTSIVNTSVKLGAMLHCSQNIPFEFKYRKVFVLG
jgi:hypothetical protein